MYILYIIITILVLKQTYTVLRDNILLQKNQRYSLLLRYYEYVNQTMYYKYC